MLEKETQDRSIASYLYLLQRLRFSQQTQAKNNKLEQLPYILSGSWLQLQEKRPVIFLTKLRLSEENNFHEVALSILFDRKNVIKHLLNPLLTASEGKQKAVSK